mmetsp:Transcript_151579/g.267525  ORF Transcript_151579/g.267525 Transcript_151579/m.267525 type:complete len:96 (+) Transcript_151579:57-344(+)
MITMNSLCNEFSHVLIIPVSIQTFSTGRDTEDNSRRRPEGGTRTEGEVVQSEMVKSAKEYIFTRLDQGTMSIMECSLDSGEQSMQRDHLWQPNAA